jgi:putative membrane protein
MMSESGGQPDPRVYFAAERTMLAWIRTGIAMMGLGFVVARFGLFLSELTGARLAETGAAARPPGLSLWVGTTLVLLGVVVNLGAAVRHFRFRRRFECGEPFLTPRGLLTMALSVVLASLGIGLVMFLVTLSRR